MDSFHSKLDEIENNFNKVCDEYVFSALSQLKEKQLKGMRLTFWLFVSIIAEIVLFVKNADDLNYFT